MGKTTQAISASFQSFSNMTPTRNSRVSESLTMPVSAFETALRIMLTSLVSRETSRPDAVSWKNARSKRKDVGEDPALQIGDDALPDEGHQHRLPVGGGAPDQRYPDDRDRDHDEQRAVLLQEDLVQHRLHEIGERCDGAGGKDPCRARRAAAGPGGGARARGRGEPGGASSSLVAGVGQVVPRLSPDSSVNA